MSASWRCDPGWSGHWSVPPPPPRPAGHRQLRPGPGRRDARRSPKPSTFWSPIPTSTAYLAPSSTPTGCAGRVEDFDQSPRPAGGPAARRTEAHRMGARPAVAADRHDRRRAGDLRPRLGRRRGHRPLALPALPDLGAGDDHHATALAGCRPRLGRSARRTDRLRRGMDRLHAHGRPLRGRARSAPSSAGSPSTSPSASAPGAPSSAPTPPRTTPCGPTSPCSSSATRPSAPEPPCRRDNLSESPSPIPTFKGEHHS